MAGRAAWHVRLVQSGHQCVVILQAGSETAPFKWKDYAARVFHRLRQSFGIDNRCEAGSHARWSATSQLCAGVACPRWLQVCTPCCPLHAVSHHH